MGDLVEIVATAIYAGGDEPEWLTTSNDSPNSASYEHARRALSALVPLLTKGRCPGCGNVVGESSRCAPHGMDVTKPGYRYLAGRWGYCRTLLRHLDESEGVLWLTPSRGDETTPGVGRGGEEGTT